MYKVFLVEDEVIIREGLRKMIPWEQCGYIYIGDASDGEMALPMIRNQPPDVLITDIKMPFMDGLALSQRVHQEFPATKIIIISGYDDFSYARQAISLGVEQYLLKPITKAGLVKALGEVREKLEIESEQKQYLNQFRQEAKAFESFNRRRFFEKLISGKMTVDAIYEEAQKLEIDIAAQNYNIVLYTAKDRNPDFGQGDAYSDPLADAFHEIEGYLLRCNCYELFRWNINIYAVLVKGDMRRILEETKQCVDNIRRRFEPREDKLEWYAAAASPVQRLSSLRRCFDEAAKILSYRHLCAEQHILNKDSIAALMPQDIEKNLKTLDISKLSSETVQNFMKNGSASETKEFVKTYLDRVGRRALDSALFGQYVMLNVRFSAVGYVTELGIAQEELLGAVANLPSIDKLFGVDNVEHYLVKILARAIELRNQASSNRYHEAIRHSLHYIDEHYADPAISLNEVAKSCNISSNYFSALFSQEMRQTFVEYLTQKRMEQAEKLLRKSDRRSSEIALMVGYKDPHYFSYLFKKMHGCTPRDYRTKGGEV